MIDLTASKLKELVLYDPDTGHFTWKARGVARWDKVHAGRRAGNDRTTKPHGYKCRQIRVLGKNYYEHRLAWVYMTGCQPPDQVDHINRDATDNSWANLKASNNSDNHRNQSSRSNNTSGIVGVTWHKTAKKWQSQTTMDGKCHYHGLFDDLSKAKDAAFTFRSKNGFSPDHGVSAAHYKTEVAA